MSGHLSHQQTQNSGNSSNSSNSGFSWGDFAQNAWNLYQDNKNQRKLEGAAQDFADKTKYDPYNLTSPVGGVSFEDGFGMATFTPEMDTIFNDLLTQHANYSDRLQNYDPVSAQQEKLELKRSMFAPQQARDRLALESRLVNQGMFGSRGGAGLTQSLLESQAQRDRAAEFETWEQVQQEQLNLQGARTQSLTDIFNLTNQLTGLFSTGGNIGDMRSARNYYAYDDLEAANAAPSTRWGGINTDSNNPNALDIDALIELGENALNYIGLFTPNKKKTTPLLGSTSVNKKETTPLFGSGTYSDAFTDSIYL
jgi:hypothetical protein